MQNTASYCSTSSSIALELTYVIRYKNLAHWKIFVFKIFVRWEMYENKPVRNNNVWNIFNTKYNQITIIDDLYRLYITCKCMLESLHIHLLLIWFLNISHILLANGSHMYMYTLWLLYFPPIIPSCCINFFIMNIKQQFDVSRFECVYWARHC